MVKVGIIMSVTGFIVFNLVANLELTVEQKEKWDRLQRDALEEMFWESCYYWFGMGTFKDGSDAYRKSKGKLNG